MTGQEKEGDPEPGFEEEGMGTGLGRKEMGRDGTVSGLECS